MAAEPRSYELEIRQNRSQRVGTGIGVQRLPCSLVLARAGRGLLAFTASRLQDDWLIIATAAADPQQALQHYKQRGSIETLFGCLKSRGFNLEDTHLRHPERLSRLFALLALVFVWTLRTAQARHEKQPIPF